jgi:peptidoglycan/LPS O-acetylase OafA/YrhL
MNVMGYRRDVDGLRAVAVLAVILHHAWKEALPGGFLGVDIFFVISGFVIAASLERNGHLGLAPALAAFYARRIKRLLPALVVFAAVTAVLISLFNPTPGQSLATGLFALLGLANLHLLATGADYFGDAVRMNPFTHTWSLGVEEQFYLVFPALVWLLGRGQGARRTRHIMVLGALAAASLAACAALAPARPDLAYYLMPLRFWELAAGAVTFWATGARADQAPAWLQRSATPALALLVAALWLPEQQWLTATVLACALSCVVLAGTRAGGAGHALLASRAMVFIGLISYSLYLWHWGLLVIARWTIGLHWWSLPLVIALTFAAAVASYRFVERPLRHARWSLTPAREIALGLGGAAAAGAIVFALADTYQGRIYTGRLPALSKHGIETLADPHTVGGSTWQGLRCILGHNGQVGRVLSPEGCTLGDFQHARSRVLVIGNSFAAAMIPAFDPLVLDGHAVTLVAAWGASPVPEVPNATVLKAANDFYWTAVVPSLIARLRAGDRVVIVSDMAAFAPARPSGDDAERLALLEQGLKRLAADLGTRGIGLAVQHGLPLMREANCTPSMGTGQWFSPAGRPCNFLSRHETLQRRAALDRVLRGLEAQGLLAVVDLIDHFCPGETCGFEGPDGTLLYRDMHSHPSVEAARQVAPRIRAVVGVRKEV